MHGWGLGCGYGLRVHTSEPGIPSVPGIQQALNTCTFSICEYDEVLVGHKAQCEHASVHGSSGGFPSVLNSALSPGELLQWLEGQHLFHGLMASGDPMLVLAPQPPPQASGHHHHRRAAATNPARHCCLSGCTRQDLLTLCPH